MSVINGQLTRFQGGRNGFFGDNNYRGPSGVTAGTYGSGTQVAQVTVDSTGTVTAASNVAISGASPTGAAGGALSGTYPNPQLAVQTQALNMGTHAITGILADTADSSAYTLGQFNYFVTASNQLNASGIAAGVVTWTPLGVNVNPKLSFCTMLANGTLQVDNTAGVQPIRLLHLVNINGNNAGNTWTFSALENAGQQATVTTNVNSGNNSSNLVFITSTIPGILDAVGVAVNNSGGTFTLSGTSGAGAATPNQWQIFRLN